MTTISTTLSSHALGAKSIKKELASAFPGIKFSVKSKSYSGGDSINVSWKFGPTSGEVDSLIGKYQQGSFDGMIDLYTYEKNNFAEEHGGAKYVHSQRGFDGYQWNGSVFESVGKALCELQKVAYDGQYTRHVLGQGDDLSLSDHVNTLLYNTSFKAGEFPVSLRYATDTERTSFYKCGRSPWAIIETELK